MGKMSIMVQRNRGPGRIYPEINFIKIVPSFSNHDSTIDGAVTKTTTTWHVESTAKVAEGNVICRIRPTMMAPHDKDLPGPPNSSLCLGCCKWFEASGWKCSACNWPVCSAACEHDTLHSQYECGIFQGKCVEPFRGIYDAILAYRVISLISQFRQKKLLKLYEDWKALPIKSQPTLSDTLGKSVDEKIQKFLLHTCGLRTKKGFNTNEDIEQLLHFIACNSLCQDTAASAYDVRGIRNYHSAKYLFPSMHAFGQSCCPNISHTINFGGVHVNDSYLLLWTTQKLDVGDKIYGDFHEPCVKLGTFERRQVHKKLGNPICHCDRCKDPTELGSYASAVSCPDCQQNYLLPVDPLDDESKWKCSNCKCLMEAGEIYKKLHTISCDIDDFKDDLSGLIRLMKSLQATLHPCHYLYCRVADYIVDLGWNFVKNGTITSFALYNFEPFIQAQMKCSAFAKFISPGHTIHRAKYIYFWQMIEGIRLTQRAVYCNQNYVYDEGQTIVQKLEQIHRYQKYVIKILSWQNVGSSERSLLELLIKSESELAELLRTSFTTDILKTENIEILKKAFSYFCNKVYELPSPLNVECISLPTVELGEYSKFFGY